MIAQAVVDRIDERERINRLADIVVARVITMQQEEATMDAAETEKNTGKGEN
jgi:hypothetical protein